VPGRDGYEIRASLRRLLRGSGVARRETNFRGSLSPFGGRGQDEGARVVYPKHSSGKHNCGVALAALVFGGLALSSGAAEPNINASQTNREEVITILGEKPAVEQGDKSIFTALPPRDLWQRPLTESPGLETATTIIGRQEIEWLNSYSIMDAMKYAPGAWTEARGRKEKQLFSLRGQRYPYPGYLVDGAWFRDFTEASFFMNAAFVERLELTRSSGDLLLSPGGQAGNINIVPHTYLQPETHYHAEYGRFNTTINQFGHGGAFARGSYGLGLGHHHSDGPGDKNGRENVMDAYGRLLFQATPRLQLSLIGYAMRGDREFQLADPPAMATLRQRRESYDPMTYYFLIGKARYEVDDRAATEAVMHYANRRNLHHQEGAADRLEKDTECGLRLTQSLNLSENNNLRFSGMYNHWETPTGKRFYVGNRGDLDTFAATVADEHKFGRLTLNAGYRFSQTYIGEFGGFHVEGSTAGIAAVKVRNEWEDPLHTLGLGGKFELGGPLSLHANFTWGQIASQPGMLTAALERPATETRWKYDLGVKAVWPQFGEVVLSGFFVAQKDAPLPKNASVLVNGVPFVLYENSDAQNLGVELDIRTRRFDSGLQVFANGVLMTTRREVNGRWRDDPEVPDVLLGGGISYLLRRWEVVLLARHVGLYENDRFLPAGARPVDLGDYLEINAVLNYYLGKKRQHRIYLGADNLTNEKYSTVVGYPSQGLFLKGGLSLKF